MSGVWDGDRLRRAHRLLCSGWIIKSTYGTSLEELIIYMQVKKMVYRPRQELKLWNSNTDKLSIQDVSASDQYKRQLWGWKRSILSLIFLHSVSHIPRQNHKLFVHFQIESGKGPCAGFCKYRYWWRRRATGCRNVSQVHASTGARHAVIWRVVGASNPQFSNRLQIVINKCLWLTWRIS